MQASSRRMLRSSMRMHAWLRDHGSLTKAIVGRCDGRFRVEVLLQCWGKPLASERKLLGMRAGEVAIIREVKLLCNDGAWVFARTLIPVSSLRGKARQLAFLGNKPLGAVLFSSPSTRRKKIQYARLDNRHALYAQACSHSDHETEDLWGRRTLFEYAGKPILVNEIFLPEIPER